MTGKTTGNKLTKHELAVLLTEKRWREARKDCQMFVERYVYIEDRDAPGLAVPFHLWPKQVEALRAFVERWLTVVLKARQLGLTWLALAYAVWRLTFQSGYSVVALSRKEDDAKELVRRITFILRHLPAWMTREKSAAPQGFAGPVWEATTLAVTVYHPGGEPSTFKSALECPRTIRR